MFREKEFRQAQTSQRWQKKNVQMKLMKSQKLFPYRYSARLLHHTTRLANPKSFEATP